MWWYRVEVCVRTHIDDEALHEIQLRANTYAIVDAVEANRDTDVGELPLQRQDRRSQPVAALGALLTLIEQVSGPIGLVEEGSDPSRCRTRRLTAGAAVCPCLCTEPG